MIRWPNLPMGGGESGVVCRLGILWGGVELVEAAQAGCLFNSEGFRRLERTELFFPRNPCTFNKRPRLSSDATRVEASRLPTNYQPPLNQTR